MASSINKVTLLGNLGRDPDYRVTPTGLSVCKFSIATSESFKNSSDQWEERTEWHNVECWRHFADTANKFLKKGTKVYIEGKLKTETYEKDGITRYSTKVVVTELVLVQPKGENAGGGEYNNSRPAYNNNASANNNASGGSNYSKPAPAPSNDEYNIDMESDDMLDVPF